MLVIVGTIKIDGGERLEHLVHNLNSMKPIAHALAWSLNVAGRRSADAKDEIKWRWTDAFITTDDESPAYPVMRAQLKALPRDALALYWLEDHWFVCENPAAFLRMVDDFAKSAAEVLTISHLTCSWEQKAWLPVVSYKEDLYTEYRVDAETQERVWAHHPGAYLAGIPMVCKRRLAWDILQHCRGELEATRRPAPVELPPHKARTFLEKRGFNEIVPAFHVFREVFRETSNPRAVLWDEAVRIIEGRGT